MRFLLDVHIATSLSRALDELGQDVVRAGLTYATGSNDRLLALAVNDERLIVTRVSDFSDLIYAFGKPPPPAVIYVRANPKIRSISPAGCSKYSHPSC